MRVVALNLAAASLFLVSAVAARADIQNETLKFAVLRNDSQIGTNIISVGREGADTKVQIVTHISVGFAFLTLYKFDQTETEQWAGDRLVALSSETDDNGKLHRVVVNNRDGKLVVEGDGQVREASANVLPISLWNPSLPQSCTGLDPEDGTITPVSVVDRGEDNLVVGGRAEHAHHYLIKGQFSQDAWYDSQNQLIQVQMRGRDGSTIRYQLMS